MSDMGTIRQYLLIITFQSLLILSPVAVLLAAEDSFVVQQITVTGLQRIPEQTVISYLPVHIGQTVTSVETTRIIRALFMTLVFLMMSSYIDRVIRYLSNYQNICPTIGAIKISGNKQIKTDDLMKALKQAGIVEGENYDQAVVDAMKQALLSEYHRGSRYAAIINIHTTNQTRHRVAVDIQITEGKVAKVKEIHLVGNHAFSTKVLLKNFELTRQRWWAITDQS